MEKGGRFVRSLRRFSWILLYLIGIAVICPILISVLAGYPSGTAVSFLLSAFALQAAVPPVGVALGLPVWLILVILAWFAAGVVLGIYEICITLGASSERVAAFIGKVAAKTEQYPMIKKYGPITCILIAWIPGIGLYGTPVIAWMLGWKRIPSVVCTATGFLIAAVFVLFFASRINEILHVAALAGLLVYVVTVSLAIGLSFPLARISGTIRQPLTLAPLLIVNLILVPTAAYLLASFLSLPPGNAGGLILISLSAGAPTLVGYLKKSGGAVEALAPFAVILCLTTVVFIPLALPFAIPGEESDPALAALTLGILVLFPVAAGWAFRRRNETAAERWSPRLNKVSLIALAVTVTTMLVLFTTEFFTIPEATTVLAAILIVLLSYTAGFAAGLGDRAARQVFGLVTAPRNIGAALAVAFLVVREGPVMAMVLICGLLGFVPSALFWWRLRKKGGALTGAS